MKKLISIVFISFLVCFPIARAQSSPSEECQEKGELKKAAVSRSDTQRETTPPEAVKPGEKKALADEDCGCDSYSPADVVAVVNGSKITIKDLDEYVRDEIGALKQYVINARKRELGLQINSKLLVADAKKRGISATDLLRQEVISAIKAPTDEAAQAFYDQNKARIKGEFKDVKADIINHLREQQEGNEAAKFADRLRAKAEIKVLIENATPPKSETDRARVLAVAGGEPVTSGDIEDSLRPLIFNVQEKLYDLRSKQLQMVINTMLLEQEANKRKVTTNALIDTQVAPKVKPITEADAQKFYEKNKDKITGEFAQLKPQIIEYLQQLERRSAEAAFVDKMRQAATINIMLLAPEPPAYTIATDDQPTRGNPNATVTIVEFSDFECSTCAAIQPVIERLLREYEGKVRLVVRDYPLERHLNAFKAAEAAEAAREQQKYWEYAALLLANQKDLSVEKLKEYASRLNLDRKRFDDALNTGKFSEKVQRDIQDGWKVGVNATPTIFVNSRRVSDRTYDGLKAAIEAALKSSARNGQH